MMWICYTKNTSVPKEQYRMKISSCASTFMLMEDNSTFE